MIWKLQFWPKFGVKLWWGLSASAQCLWIYPIGHIGPIGHFLEVSRLVSMKIYIIYLSVTTVCVVEGGQLSDGCRKCRKESEIITSGTLPTSLPAPFRCLLGISVWHAGRNLKKMSGTSDIPSVILPASLPTSLPALPASLPALLASHPALPSSLWHHFRHPIRPFRHHSGRCRKKWELIHSSTSDTSGISSNALPRYTTL